MHHWSKIGTTIRKVGSLPFINGVGITPFYGPSKWGNWGEKPLLMGVVLTPFYNWYRGPPLPLTRVGDHGG